MVKRLFDVLFSAGTLIVLAPLMLAVALWIKIDSPGPILFRQARVGRGGKLFNILKFRSMRVDAAAQGPQLTVGDDPRITRAGVWIRKYKIDEFPQFVNVVLGDMSLVGPRPEVPRYVNLYPTAVRELVLSVRPGITDTASIAYRDESEILRRSADPERTYVEQVLPAKLELSQRYVREHSLAGDLAIIGRSIRVSFSREAGAR
jgi:lipopolysaccharide/colanic/teichoic acid biosynthesis glycosyltransferase